ncbi:MAG: glycosyltransferase family 2 protein [Porticoccaceae bacterium]
MSTVRGPLEEIKLFVNYHLNVGFDRLFLYFDDPMDPAIDYLENEKRVVCTRCSKEYWRDNSSEQLPPISHRQIINANNAHGKARSEGFAWIAHIDHDELVYAQGSLKTLLLSIPENGNVIRMPPLEALPVVPYGETIFSDITLFKNFPHQKQIDMAIARGCEKAFFEGEYFRGYHSPKSFLRVSAPLESMGVHRPKLKEEKDGTVLISSSIKVLHYDCSNYTAWKIKWLGRLNGVGTSISMRENRKRQLEKFSSVFDLDDEHMLFELYRELHMIPKNEIDILQTIGLLREVNIDPNLFEPCI